MPKPGQLTLGDRVITITVKPRVTYEVPLAGLKTHQDLVEWVFHLSEKSWATRHLLRQFIAAVYTHNNWTLG